MFESVRRVFQRFAVSVTKDKGIPEISVEDLKSMIDAKKDIFILDVREQSEFDHSRIPGSHLIPLMQLPDRVGEVDKTKPIVVHCKVGGRSARAVAFLLKSGFTNVVNLDGGIDSWADRIDPSLPRY